MTKDFEVHAISAKDDTTDTLDLREVVDTTADPAQYGQRLAWSVSAGTFTLRQVVTLTLS